MLAHDVAGSDDASGSNAQRNCDIIIVDLNNRQIPIKVSAPFKCERMTLGVFLTRITIYFSFGASLFSLIL